MESEGFLPYSQQPSSDFYPKPHLNDISLMATLSYHLRLGLPAASFLHVLLALPSLPWVLTTLSTLSLMKQTSSHYLKSWGFSSCYLIYLDPILSLITLLETPTTRVLHWVQDKLPLPAKTTGNVTSTKFNPYAFIQDAGKHKMLARMIGSISRM